MKIYTIIATLSQNDSSTYKALTLEDWESLHLTRLIIVEEGLLG